MRGSQKTAVIRILIAVGIILSLIVGFYTVSITRLLEKDTDLIVSELAEQGRAIIEERVNGNFSLLRGLADAVAEYEDIKSPEVMKFLQNQVSEGSGMRFVVSDLNGSGKTTDGYTSILSKDPAFIEALEKDESLSGVTTSNIKEDVRVIVFSSKIRKDGKDIGILFNVRNAAEYDDLFSYSLFNGKGSAYIVQGDGNAVFWSKDGENPLGFSGFAGLNDEELVKSVPELEQIVKAMEKKESGTLRYKPKGHRHSHLSYTPLGVNDWYLITVVSENVVARRSQMVTAIVLMSGIVAVLVLLVLSRTIFVMRDRRRKLMEQYALYDRLTGIPNQRNLENCFDDLPGGGKGYAVILFHINFFRRINTLFGFKAGSLLLKKIAGYLEDFVQMGEYAARISEDYFEILLKYDMKERFTARVKALFEGMERYEVTDGIVFYNYHCSFSGGVYLIDGSEENDFDEVNEKLNYVISRISESHQTEWQYFDVTMKDELKQQEQLEEDIVQALKNHEFVPYFQPQYMMENHVILGAEVLARWSHPTLGTLRPAQFVPVMERAGCILELDMIMLEEACKKIKKWMDRGLLPVPLSVNISHLNIHRKNFVPSVCGLIKKYRIPANLIVLELSEMAIFDNNQKVMEMAEQLKDTGFILAVDNFGTGYSSLDMLRKIPVDMIKMDRVFLPESAADERGSIILYHLLEMAKELNIEIVAEGVEKESQASFLKEIGCRMAQGFLYSEPITEEEFEKKIFPV